jgi:hypothetical protein
MNYELCSIQLQVGPEYFLDGLRRCLVRFLLVRDCSPTLHARIAIGEALFCLAVHHYSTCNFLKPTISRGLSIGKLERCLKLHTVKDVLSAFVLSQLNILARPAQPLDVRAATPSISIADCGHDSPLVERKGRCEG